MDRGFHGISGDVSMLTGRLGASLSLCGWDVLYSIGVGVYMCVGEVGLFVFDRFDWDG